MKPVSTSQKSPGLLEKAGQSLRRFWDERTGRKAPAWAQIRLHEEIDEETQRYIDDNLRRWPERPRTADTPVVLVSHFYYRPVLHNYAHLANFLADKHGAALVSYNLDHSINSQFEAVYASFGAPLGLSFADADGREEEAVERGTRMFEELQTKNDVANLEIEGLRIGDFIYNWYLRRLFEPTIDIRNPFVRDLLIEAHLVYFACESYLSRNRVVALLPNHAFYVHCGILTRMAMARGAVAYGVATNFSPTRFPEYIAANGWPENSKRPGPYYRYREIFQSLPPETQQKALRLSRHTLAERLRGVIDQKVLVHTTAWSKEAKPRVLKDTPVPKILIMAHDFCDNVHKFRRMIFPDFYEWLRFIFVHAKDTPYEWYLKPHPNLLLEEKNILNRRVLGELQREFPWITLLESGHSNNQLISEGVKAAFTVHGTSGHEFACNGIPVVNAGDNLHISFDFNFHAKTEEEFRGYIARAGELKIDIDREQIEQFCYLHFCDNFTAFKGEIADPRASYLKSRQVFELGKTSAFFRYLRENEPPGIDGVIKAHLDDFFARELDFTGRYISTAEEAPADLA
jgi:hypothetical protein